MITTVDVTLPDGRTLVVHDSGTGSALTVVWHHGTPQTGALLEPVVAAAAARDIRVVSYGRPGYGGSTVQPGRDVAGAANDVAAALDRLAIGPFAAMGGSGGGPHVLAGAARLPDRCVGAVTLAGSAPRSENLDWWAGMAAPEGLCAALSGRDARLAFAATEQFDETQFTAADWEVLGGAWRGLGQDAGRAGEQYPDGAVDDDVAFVSPWGFDPAEITAPVLVIQGGADRVIPPAHAHELVRLCPSAQLWLRPQDGHISVLRAVPVALDWLLDAVR